jgi:diaminopimelate epimerase
MISYVGDVNGNRLLLLDLRNTSQVSAEDLAQLSESLCATGSIDDLLAIEKSDTAFAKLRITGADRREADFCGDGFLFVAHILFEELRAAGHDATSLLIETKRGVKSGVRNEDGSVSAMIGPVGIRDGVLTVAARRALEGLGVRYEGFRIAGEPHLVVSAPPGSDVHALDQSEFEHLARQLAPLIAYDGGVNVTMILSSAPQTAKIRTFERGVKRMTLACGSGAVAAASLIYERDRTKTDFRIESPGGLHLVSTDRDGRDWLLAAEAIHVDAMRDFHTDIFDPEREEQRLLHFILA